MKKLLLIALLIVGCEEIQVEDLLGDFSNENPPITTITTINSL